MVSRHHVDNHDIWRSNQNSTTKQLYIIFLHYLRYCYGQIMFSVIIHIYSYLCETCHRFNSIQSNTPRCPTCSFQTTFHRGLQDIDIKQRYAATVKTHLIFYCVRERSSSTCHCEVEETLLILPACI